MEQQYWAGEVIWNRQDKTRYTEMANMIYRDGLTYTACDSVLWTTHGHLMVKQVNHQHVSWYQTQLHSC